MATMLSYYDQKIQAENSYTSTMRFSSKDKNLSKKIPNRIKHGNQELVDAQSILDKTFEDARRDPNYSLKEAQQQVKAAFEPVKNYLDNPASTNKPRLR